MYTRTCGLSLYFTGGESASVLTLQILLEVDTSLAFQIIPGYTSTDVFMYKYINNFKQK